MDITPGRWIINDDATLIVAQQGEKETLLAGMTPTAAQDKGNIVLMASAPIMYDLLLQIGKHIEYSDEFGLDVNRAIKVAVDDVLGHLQATVNEIIARDMKFEELP